MLPGGCSNPQESRLATMPKNPDFRQSPRMPEVRSPPKILTYSTPTSADLRQYTRMQESKVAAVSQGSRLGATPKNPDSGFQQPPRIQTYGNPTESRFTALPHESRLTAFSQESKLTAFPKNLGLQRSPLRMQESKIVAAPEESRPPKRHMLQLPFKQYVY